MFRSVSVVYCLIHTHTPEAASRRIVPRKIRQRERETRERKIANMPPKQLSNSSKSSSVCNSTRSSVSAKKLKKSPAVSSYTDSSDYTDDDVMSDQTDEDLQANKNGKTVSTAARKTKQDYDNKSKRKLIFSIEKIHDHIRKYKKRVDVRVPVMLTAIEETIVSNILDRAIAVSGKRHSDIIMDKDITAAICGNDDLRAVLFDCMIHSF